MLLAMLVFPGFIFVLELATSVESLCSDEKIMCRCGTSSATFSIWCMDDYENEDPCEAYEHCETCENDLAHCLTCPSGYTGPFCDNEEGSGSWQGAPQTSGKEETGSRLVSRDLSCPELRAPKLGSFSCWYQDYEKECTGRCLAGHSFESKDKSIKLVCQSGVWTPYTSFPPCLSEGYCKFDLSGGGHYNCTIGARGTYCDITCYRRGYRPITDRFHCYPGKSWDPPLPYCATEKEPAGGSGIARETFCECQNGGSCNSRYQQCDCRPGFKGRLCELKEYRERSLCALPDPVKDGETKNADGSLVTRSQQFYEGSSVVYSCRSGFALVGESLLTCTKQGTWSNSVPKCSSLEQPKTGPRPNELRTCPDPGQVVNGVRRRINKQRIRNQPFVEGSSVVFVCNDGFALLGESLLTCTSSGKWSPSQPTCRRIKSTETETTTEDDGLVYCKDPGVSPNGIKLVSPWISPRRRNSNSEETEYPQGTQIDYRCEEGYNLQGETHVLCLFSGRWSSPIPTCYPKPASVTRGVAYCNNPGDIRNGKKAIVPVVDPRTKENVLESSADLPQGVKFVYNCDTGFSVRGSKIIECKSTGTWSSAPPTCEQQEDSVCGHSYFAMAGKVLLGDKTVEGEWPWQVAYAENRRSVMNLKCGAVLIDHRTVLTAAHCVTITRLDKTFLYFGKYYSDFNKDDEGVLSRKVSEFIVHPRYNRRNYDNDIAIVRFSPEVPYNTRIQPVCLPTAETTAQDMAHDAKGWVTGWGTTENGTDSELLLMAELPVVSTSRCRDTYRRLNLAVQITNNMYCAGYESGGTDSCSGDSGGPMVFFNRRTESYVLEGLVSFGVKGPTGACGQKNRYGVYTKVSNYVQWIQQYT